MSAESGPLLVREPALHQYAYFLRQAGEDVPAARRDRQRAFLDQLKAAVARLCSLVGEEPPPVALSEPEQMGRHQQVQVYPPRGEGPLHRTDGTRYVWLWAYAVHDSYLIRAIYAATGQYPVQALNEMVEGWLWRPAPHPDLLGDIVYHAAIVPAGTARAFAQAALEAWTGEEEVELVSARTPAGPLSAPWAGGDVYALAYADDAAEARANHLFDVVIPELAWYGCKVRAQGARYGQVLYPALHAAEDAVNAAIEMVLEQDRLGGSTSHRLSRLETQLHDLSDGYVHLSRLVGQAEMMGQTMTINATNYEDTLPRLLAGGEDPAAVAAAWLRLGYRDQAQIEADLAYQRMALERAETVLETIQSRVDLLRGEIDRRTNLIFALIGIGVGVLEVTGLQDTTLLVRVVAVVASLAVLYGLWWLWQKRRGR
jgi:hypothetical protein